jgi:hypothetical protein
MEITFLTSMSIRRTASTIVTRVRHSCRQSLGCVCVCVCACVSLSPSSVWVSESTPPARSPLLPACSRVRLAPPPPPPEAIPPPTLRVAASDRSSWALSMIDLWHVHAKSEREGGGKEREWERERKRESVCVSVCLCVCVFVCMFVCMCVCMCDTLTQMREKPQRG